MSDEDILSDEEIAEIREDEKQRLELETYLEKRNAQFKTLFGHLPQKDLSDFKIREQIIDELRRTGQRPYKL